MDVAPIVAIVPVVILVAFIVLLVKRRIVDGSSGLDMRGVIGVLAVVMMAVMVMGCFVPGDGQERADFELYDCVPASSFGSGVSVSGSAEIVEIGGTEYVRMADLGDFSVVASGTERSYTVGKASLDLVLLSGQSNSMYYTAPRYLAGQPSPVAPGKAFYLGSPDPINADFAGLATQSSIGTAGIVDLVADDGMCRVAQMYPTFMADYVSETGHRVLVVNSGLPGRGIAKWDTGEECDVWNADVLARAKALEDQGLVELRPVVALWSQGEADTWQSQDYYKSHLVPFLGRLSDGHYSGYVFDEQISVLPRYPNFSYENMSNPAKAQLSIASEDRHFHIASDLPYRFGPELIRDSVHYTQPAYGWLGEAFAREAASVMGLRPVAETIVICEDVGAVQELPRTVTCYGTSGASFELSVAWSETETGYEGALSGNPAGTQIRPGLAAQAELSSG